MDWQQVSALAIVAVTAVLMVRGIVKRRQEGTAGHCCEGCSMNVEKADGKPYH